MKELNRKIILLFLIFMIIQNTIISIYFFGSLKRLSDAENEKYYFSTLDKQIWNIEQNIRKLKDLGNDLSNNANMYALMREGFDREDSGNFFLTAQSWDTQVNILAADIDFVRAVIIIPDTDNVGNFYTWYSPSFNGFNIDASKLPESVFGENKYNLGKIRWEGENTLYDFSGNTVSEFLAVSDLIHISQSGAMENLGLAVFALDKDKLFDCNADCEYLKIENAEKTLFTKNDGILSENLDISEFSDGMTAEVKGGNKKMMTFFMRQSDTLGWKFLYGIKSPGFSKSMTVLFIWMLVLICLSLLVTMYMLGRWSKNTLKPIGDINDALSKIADNDFDVSLPVNKNEELSSICENINYTARMIDKSISVMQAHAERERNLQLQIMQYQINPHFLYNTLASIRARTLKNSDFAAAEDIMILSKMLKKVLSNRAKMSTLEDEIELLKSYIYFHSLRCEYEINAHYDIDGELESFFVPNLLLQPIVENSIFHGLSDNINDKKEAKIVISAKKEADKTVISVTDNGCGMTEEKIKSLLSEDAQSDGKSVGIANIRERIKLVYGKHGQFDIKSRVGEFTSVIITVYDYINKEGSLS